MASWFANSPRWVKAIVFGGGLLMGVSTYAALRYYERRKSRFQDEGFEDTSRIEEQPEKRILVLGLDGAGKSSFLANLSKSEQEPREIKPTEGFNVMCVNTNGTSVNIWEIGGSENFRVYWYNFLQDTDVLVFVVDSADTKKLPVAYDEFHKLLLDERLKQVPILVLANKQDLFNALRPEDIEEALNLNNIKPKQHVIRVLGTQIQPDRPPHPSIQEAEEVMIRLAFTRA